MATTRKAVIKQCSRCNTLQPIDNYVKTKSYFYPDGHIPICNSCLASLIESCEGNWEFIDRICQYVDLPFVPKEWEKMAKAKGYEAFPYYARIFDSEEYEHLGWKEYYDEFKKLKTDGQIERELPALSEEVLKKLSARWGANYSEEQLDYLENLYSGMLATQNVNGALQVDQALKLCKISLEIDERLRAGQDIDKLLGSYDKLVKVSDFTPKNVKNASDFDSVGELYAYLEKTGWVNRYYTGVKKDVVDETMENIQNFCQRLYTNEPGIGDDIERRIAALKSARDLEAKFDIVEEDDFSQYDNATIEELNKKEEFEIDV